MGEPPFVSRPVLPARISALWRGCYIYSWQVLPRPFEALYWAPSSWLQSRATKKGYRSCAVHRHELQISPGHTTNPEFTIIWTTLACQLPAGRVDDCPPRRGKSECTTSCRTLNGTHTDTSPRGYLHPSGTGWYLVCPIPVLFLH